MPISYNGSGNPAAVRFNSTNLSQVYFAPDRNSNFTRVWGNDINFPSSISLIRAYNSFRSGDQSGTYGNRGCYDIYLRDLAFSKTYLVLYPNTGYIERRVEYVSQSCSFDFDWDSGRMCGYIYPPSDCSSMQSQLYGTAATVSGIPSSLSGFTRLVLLPEITWAFDVDYRDYTGSWIRRTSVTYDISSVSLDTSATLYNGRNVIFMEAVSTSLVLDEGSNTAWCYMANSGLITQAPATLRFTMPY